MVFALNRLAATLGQFDFPLRRDTAPDGAFRQYRRHLLCERIRPHYPNLAG